MLEDAYERPVLLTGATTFVARYLRPALNAAGYEVRVPSDHGAAHCPNFVEPSPQLDRSLAIDLSEPKALRNALEGCSAVIHVSPFDDGRRGSDGLRARNERNLEQAASDAGLLRIVHLVSGAEATTPPRLDRTRGEILRGGRIPAVEIRAPLVIGKGGEGWASLRRVASRSRWRITPACFDHPSRPVAIEDLVVGLLAALELHDDEVGVYGAPGPSWVSPRELLGRLRNDAIGRSDEFHVTLPEGTLSTLCLAAFGGVTFGAAHDLEHQLAASLRDEPTIFRHIPGFEPTTLDRAIAGALSDETDPGLPTLRALDRIRDALTSVVRAAA